jgi:large subunit ribosomal protein L23
MPTTHRTIVRPIVTEKSSAAYQDRGEYTFEVHPDANKQSIKQSIETLFGVKVTGVASAPRPACGRAGRRPS